MSLNIAVWRCKHCGCLWRDNLDASVSLLDAQQKSCTLCEQMDTISVCVVQWITVEPVVSADPRDAELARLRAALEAWTIFADPHDGGCQFPHGGRCSCGWNLIAAALEQAKGATVQRVDYLRSSVRFAHDDDRERVDNILARLARAITPSPEGQKGTSE